MALTFPKQQENLQGTAGGRCTLTLAQHGLWEEAWDVSGEGWMGVNVKYERSIKEMSRVKYVGEF